MPTFKQELKWHLKYLIGWTIAVVLTISLFMSFFSSFDQSMNDLIEMLKGFPAEFLKGLSIEAESFKTYSGFLAYLYTFVQLLLGIFSVLSGMILIGREKLNNTNDFLFSKPVSRSGLWIQKNAVGILSIFIINIIIFITVYVIALIQEVPYDIAVMDIILSSFIVQLIFFFLGGLIANIKKHLHTVTGTASSVGIGFYFLLIIGRLLEDEKLSKLSIYGLFDTTQVQQNGIDLINLIIAFFICVIFAVISYLHYIRVDVEV